MKNIVTSFVASLALAAPALAIPHKPLDDVSSLVRARQNTFDPSESRFYNPNAKASAELKKLKPKWGSGAKGRGFGLVEPGKRKHASLKKEIMLGWEDPDELTQATLTADWAEDDNTKVINFEDFHDAVEAVDCTAPYIFIDFSDADVYADAKAQWAWVNDKREYQIIAFANHPGCGPDGVREPYRVQSLTFDDAKFKVDMKVTEIEKMDDVLVSAELVIETLVDANAVIPPPFWNETQTEFDSFDVPEENAGDVQARDEAHQLHKRDVSISLNKDMSGKTIFEFEVGEGDASGKVGLECAECGTHGMLRIDGHVSWSWFVPTEARVEIRANDVEAMMKLKLYAEAEASKAAKLVLASPGIHVNLYKIIRLEAVVDIGVGGDVAVAAKGDVTFGTIGRMSDSLWRICLWGCSDRRTGWSWDFEKIAPAANGEIAIDINVFCFMNPRVYVGAFGHGFEGGVAVLAPKFHGHLAIEADSQGGVCDKVDTTVGIDIELDIGLEIFAYVGQEFQDTTKEWPIYEFAYVFFDKCYPLVQGGQALPPGIVGAEVACTDFNHYSLYSAMDETMGMSTDRLEDACTASPPDYAEAYYNCEDWVRRGQELNKPTAILDKVRDICTNLVGGTWLNTADIRCHNLLDYDWVKSRNSYGQLKDACETKNYTEALATCNKITGYTSVMSKKIAMAVHCTLLRGAISSLST